MGHFISILVCTVVVWDRRGLPACLSVIWEEETDKLRLNTLRESEGALKPPNFPMVGLSVAKMIHHQFPLILHTVYHITFLRLHVLFCKSTAGGEQKPFQPKKQCHRNRVGDRPFIVFTLPEAPIRTISAGCLCVNVCILVCVCSMFTPTHYTD